MIENLTIITSLLGVVRIATYKRNGAHYNFMISMCAYLLMVMLFTTAIMTIKTGEACGEWTIFIMVIVGILFKRKGNVSWKK